MEVSCVLGKELLFCFYILGRELLQLCAGVDGAQVDLQVADAGIAPFP